MNPDISLATKSGHFHLLTTLPSKRELTQDESSGNIPLREMEDLLAGFVLDVGQRLLENYMHNAASLQVSLP